jgi:hypothetical protein
MKNQENTPRQIDLTVSQLCYKIDDLREEVEYWKTKYEEEVAENNKRLNESIEMSKRGLANALMFALSVTDDEKGNLVIPKEKRKKLAQSWK